MQTVSEEKLQQFRSRYPEWKVAGKQRALKRIITHDNFLAGAQLFVALTALAEKHNHHPDVTVTYTRSTVQLTTHDAGGITQKDLRLAQAIEKVIQK